MSALDRITVLDLSRVFAAPLATQMLSDLGATVWKVESFNGDESRKWGQHVFDAFNRGKQSLVVNLKDPRGQAMLRRLAGRADILVENFKTGDLGRYGLSYAALATDNPKLIYASLTGFGHTGPRRQQPGYDTIVQAMTGVMTATGEAAGPPTRVGIAWIDVMAGLVTTIGILAALGERERSGVGQQIDLSLFDVGAMALVDMGQDYLETGRVQRRAGNVTRNISPAQSFRTSDGWIMIAVGNDGQFRRLCAALALPELQDDSRFASNLSRVAHRDALSAVLAPVFQRLPREHWVDVLRGAQVPTSPILDVAEALADAQAKARDAVWHIDAGNGRMFPCLANPLRHMGRTPARPAGPPPALGEHTAAVLARELGVTADELEKLRSDAVIAWPEAGCEAGAR